MPKRTSARRAVVAVFTLVLVIVLVGFTALTVDVGHLYNARAELQHGADAAALAGAQELPDASNVRAVAAAVAKLNQGRYGNVLASSDVIVGNWSARDSVFIANANPPNAVRVTLRRAHRNGNPLKLFFAGIFGKTTMNVSASATVADEGSPGRVRFLIDDEILDTDEPAIEDLADDLGISPDRLLSDNDGDHFIDIPGGEVLELPTGQVGDEGLFAIASNFEFTPTSNPSLVDFLLYDKDGDSRGISESDLDPLVGVDPVSSSSEYASYVDPTQILVSPVYKSDVSNTNPYVQAKGERRGLLAFRIIGVGADPDGGGSKLPNLIFEIVDPAEVDLNNLTVSTGGASNVELVE